jgi:hypothetical protein
MDYTFTPHALEQMQERNIPLQTVLTVLNEPEQIVPAKNDRSACQSKVTMSDGEYLLRLIVDADGMVVTIYLTSKIEKYWSES